MLGGGMRQAGIIAAAGLYALQNNIERLQEDHDHTLQLATALEQLPGFALAEPVQTNMIMLDPSLQIDQLAAHLLREGIKISRHRWVLHKDISSADVAHIIKVCREYSATMVDASAPNQGADQARS